MLKGKPGEGAAFVSAQEAIFAYNAEKIHLQSPIKIRMEDGKTLETTVGRVLFNQIVPEGLEFQNKSFGKKELSNILMESYSQAGVARTAQLADDIKTLGFKYATKSGISISVFDLKEPKNRERIIEDANELVSKITIQYRYGLITDEERYNSTIRIWSRVKNDITEEMIQEYDAENDIFYQINSGARGNWGQVTQIAGMKGLVASPSGRTIELPIRSNLKQGFTILEYFIATHGGRKGKSDTALKTAEAGYLTRRLVDSVQDMVVNTDECGTLIGKTVTRQNSVDLGMDFERRVFGRVLAEPVKKGTKVLIEKGVTIGEKEIEIIEKEQVAEATVRSVMYCKTRDGVCKNCYGYDLGNKKTVKMGTPVGIIAAQSIGEPGTQLTMRTFHMGGVAIEGMDMAQGLTRVEELFEARSPKNPAILAEITGELSIKRGRKDTKIIITADKPEDEVHLLGYEIEPTVKKGDTIKEKQIIARSAETKETVKSRCAGEVIEVNSGHVIVRQNEASKKVYTAAARVTLRVKDGDFVKKGQAITNGHLDLRQLMELTSVERVQEYILYEVQGIYASQGQDISEKHIEIIVKQMVSKVRIIDPGDSELLAGEVRDFIEVEKINEELRKKKKNIILYERLLLGLTRISLWTDSWLSAASFQETIRVLVNAAVENQRDDLDGLKENVIIGRLIPAGTGYVAANKEAWLPEDAFTQAPAGEEILA
jgi:DNA-directed RNA polymerase subunit beta'